MRVIKNKIREDLIVEDNITLDGMVTGSVIVRSNGVLIINGMVTGNVVIEESGRVELNGIVSGDVYNQGGSFTRNGILAGTLKTT